MPAQGWPPASLRHPLGLTQAHIRTLKHYPAIKGLHMSTSKADKGPLKCHLSLLFASIKGQQRPNKDKDIKIRSSLGQALSLCQTKRSKEWLKAVTKRQRD